MKSFLLPVLAVLGLATLASCGGGGAKGNAEKFLNAFTHLEFDKAKEVATDETKQMLDMMISFQNMGGMQAADSLKREAKKTKVNITDVKEEGESATVTYTVTDPTGATPSTPQTLKMVKQKGKWLASFTKADMMGGGAGAGGDAGGMSDPGMADPGMTDPSMTDPMMGADSATTVPAPGGADSATMTP